MPSDFYTSMLIAPFNFATYNVTVQDTDVLSIDAFLSGSLNQAKFIVNDIANKSIAMYEFSFDVNNNIVYTYNYET